MKYREERTLVIRLSLSAEFPDDYEGDEDGFAWYRDFDERVRPALLAELMRTLAREGSFRITPVNRGLNASEEVEVRAELLLGRGAKA